MDNNETAIRAWTGLNPPRFFDLTLLTRLEEAAVEDFDLLDFGLITINRESVVIGYNTYESKRAGLARDRVIGRDLFLDVAPCTNNYLVAERYWSQDSLDEQLDYVFTFRMRPTPVRLRLLASPGSERKYLAIQSR